MPSNTDNHSMADDEPVEIDDSREESEGGSITAFHYPTQEEMMRIFIEATGATGVT